MRHPPASVFSGPVSRDSVPAHNPIWFKHYKRSKEPNLMADVITTEEIWVFKKDPETNRQSSDWHTAEPPRTKQPQMNKAIKKSRTHLRLRCQEIGWSTTN